MGCFQFLTIENWNDVYTDTVRATTGVAAIFSMIMLFVGNFIFINLFSAILLSNFEAGGDQTSGSASSSTTLYKSEVLFLVQLIQCQ